MKAFEAGLRCLLGMSELKRGKKKWRSERVQTVMLLLKTGASSDCLGLEPIGAVKAAERVRSGFEISSWGVRAEKRQEKMAERAGFEPAVPVSQYNGLASHLLQPLGHRSTTRKSR